MFAAVLDQTHDCIKLLTATGHIEYVNRQGAALMELREPSELVGRLWLERWPESSRPKVSEALAKAATGQQARFHAMRPRPDGSPSWWDVSVSPILSAAGNLTHYLTIARDATREVTERERVQAISAEMRHRLKNAMAIASALVAMSARGKPEVQDFAEAITERLAQLSKAQSLVLDPNADRDFTALVPMLAAAYGDGASITFGELPKVSISDPAMQALALTFGELCTNSLKYGALKHGRRIRVDGEKVGDELVLIWFEQTQFGDQREGGQGLNLIERIVRASGGRLVRTNEPSHLRVEVAFPSAEPYR